MNYQKITRLLFEPLFFILLFILFCSYTSRPPWGHKEFVHFDEVYRLKKSDSFKQVFVDRDFHNPALHRWDAIMDPPVSSYIFGAALYYSGVDVNRLPEIKNRKDESDPRNWTLKNYGFVVNDKRLIIVRSIAAFFGWLDVIVLYLLIRQVSGIITGAVAVLYLAFNPIMINCSGEVGFVDTMLMFFWLSSILLSIFYIRSFNEGRFIKAIIFCVLTSFSLSLAIGTKFNAFLCWLIVAASMLLAVLKGKDNRQKWYGITCISAMSILTFIFFVLSYPYFWDAPLQKLRIVKEVYSAVVSNATAQTISSTPTLWSKISSVYDVLFWQVPILGYWREPLRPPKGIFFVVTLDLLLFALGLINFLKKVWCRLKGSTYVSAEEVIAIAMLITFIGITLWIPIRWGRYYLPFLPYVSLMIGYAVDNLIKLYKDTYALHRSHANRES